MNSRRRRSSHVQGIITRRTTITLDPSGLIKEEKTVERFTPITQLEVPIRDTRVMPEILVQSAEQRKSRDLAVEKELEKKMYQTERKESEDTGNDKRAWTKMMRSCNELKQELLGQWTEAANGITTRREEWEDARAYFEQMKTRGPWKSNRTYAQKREILEFNLKTRPDTARDQDNEIILRLASPTPTPPVPGLHRRYISLSDMTPSRLQSMSRAAKRGFGQRPLQFEELKEKLDQLKNPFSIKPKSYEEEKLRTFASPDPSRGASPSLVPSRTASTSPVNDFIFKHRSKFFKNPMSRLSLEKKLAVELAMMKIHASPEVALKVQRMEEQARRRRIQFLKGKSFKKVQPRPETPGERRDLRAEIVQYRQNPDEEIEANRRVKVKVLQSRG